MTLTYFDIVQLAQTLSNMLLSNAGQRAITALRKNYYAMALHVDEYRDQLREAFNRYAVADPSGARVLPQGEGKAPSPQQLAYQAEVEALARKLVSVGALTAVYSGDLAAPNLRSEGRDILFHTRDILFLQGLGLVTDTEPEVAALPAGETILVGGD